MDSSRTQVAPQKAGRTQYMQNARHRPCKNEIEALIFTPFTVNGTKSKSESNWFARTALRVNLTNELPIWLQHVGTHVTPEKTHADDSKQNIEGNNIPDETRQQERSICMNAAYTKRARQCLQAE